MSETWHFVLDRVTSTTACHRCERRFECELLMELEIVPLLCERVTERDLELAKLHGLELDVMNGRARMELAAQSQQ